jgi:hypothetical protein
VKYKPLFIFSSIAVSVAGCQTVEQKALNNPDAAKQVVSFDTQQRVTAFGIYRLSYDRHNNLHARGLCPADMENREFFGRPSGDGKPAVVGQMKDADPVKNTGTIEDDKVSDYITISLTPSLKEKIGDGGYKGGVEVNFADLAQAKRVVAGYTVSGKLLEQPDLDTTVDKNYVAKYLNPTCRGWLNDATKAKSQGVPAFVYKYAVADDIYTKNAKYIPKVTVFVQDKSGKKVVSSDIDLNKDTKLDERHNAIFGYQYFLLGKWTEKDIPLLTILNK